ncbi:MAG: hypothetical protein KKF53_03115, partial [Nanoarchaeota archaeon]|nr:hypothetical protein [Nanoarchaeota archaeon]MBU1445258.1 hypothetical protein [Nanoarchaeota archaeon]MBU2420208.1 hypothetical protein [Nanoarchaeota archaeon]
FLSEVNIMFNPEDNRTLFPNQETIFDVYIMYPNETAINTYTVNSVETDPNETVSYSTSGNKITINFTASRQGLYSIVLNVTDNKNNIIKQRFYLGNQSTLNYYFRPGQYPSHGQPSTYGEDSKAIKFEAPTSGENFCTCAIWVQLAIDNISESITGISRIVNVNMSFWYNLTTDDRNYVGFQKHATWSKLADYGKSISNTTQYEWTNERINLGYWIYNRTEWYWLSFKLGGDDPFLKTNVSNPSYLNLTYLFTSDPEIKNITNNNINLLSSTSTVGDSRYASIVLDGTGTTNITVQMSNNATTYSATYDGINCNTANCTFTQSEGQLDFVLTLGSEHTISISPVIPVVHTPSSSIPNPQQVFRGEDKNYTLNSNGRIRLILNGQTHNIYVKKIDKNYVDFEIYSEKIELRLYIGDKEDIDIDFDGEKEITITLEKIEGREATISIETYSPEIKVEVEKEVTEEEVKEQDNEREEINNEIPLNKALVPVIILIIALIIGIIFTILLKTEFFKKLRYK